MAIIQSGVYCWRNLINAKCYVGSTTNLHRRRVEHIRLLNAGRSPCRRLQHAWSKYGEASFEFEIIELCGAEQLLEAESYWLTALNAVSHGYNCYRDPAAPRRGATDSEQTRRRKSETAKACCSEAHRSAARQNMTAHNRSPKGRHRSLEHRRKIGLRAAGTTISQQHRAKISQNHGMRRPEVRAAVGAPIDQYSLDGTYLMRHANILSAAAAVGSTRSAISKCVNGNSQTSSGYLWRRGGVTRRSENNEGG